MAVQLKIFFSHMFLKKVSNVVVENLLTTIIEITNNCTYKDTKVFYEVIVPLLEVENTGKYK